MQPVRTQSVAFAFPFTSTLSLIWEELLYSGSYRMLSWVCQDTEYNVISATENGRKRWAEG